MATLRRCFGWGGRPAPVVKGCEDQSFAKSLKVKMKEKEERTDVHSFRWLRPRHEEVLLRSRRASRLHNHMSVLQLCVAAMHQNVDLPEVLPKNKKKPFATPKRVIATKHKGKRLQPILRPPANGMLVKGLIPVAYRVMEAKAILMEGLSLLLRVIPVVRCRFCSEIHVSSVGHNLQTCLGPQNDRRQSRHYWVKATIDDVLVPIEAYHLSDRLAPPIGHDQRFDEDRISAVDELCIQAGFDDSNYPTRRYATPIKPLNSRRMKSSYSTRTSSVFNLKDSEVNEPADAFQQGNLEATNLSYQGAVLDTGAIPPSVDQAGGNDGVVDDQPYQDDEVDKEISDILAPANDFSCSEEGSFTLLRLTAEDNLETIAEKTLQAWQMMRSGVNRLKRRYRTLACGYCPEIHVGPKGHRARVCGAFKHQWRDGRHGWQSATVNEVVPPQYVWHMRDTNGPPLDNALRIFYGQAPAVVEICVQAGLPVPEVHKPMMRLDIAIPELHELDSVF